MSWGRGDEGDVFLSLFRKYVYAEQNPESPSPASPPPSPGGSCLRLAEVGEVGMKPQTSYLSPTEDVVCRFATAAEVEDDPIRVRPQIHGRADKLRAIIAVDALREATLETEAFERRDDVPSTESLTNIDRQTLTRKQIDHRQRAEPSPIGELVGHKVHAPNLVARPGGPTPLAMDRGRMAPRSLPSEREPVLGIYAIEAVLADVPAFPVHQHQQAPVSEPHARLGHLAQALPQHGQRIAPALVAQARPPEAG